MEFIYLSSLQQLDLVILPLLSVCSITNIIIYVNEGVPLVFKDKKRVNKDLLVTIFLVLSILVCTFGMIGDFGFKESIYYIFLIILTASVYLWERRLFIRDYSKYIKKYEEEIAFKDLIYDLVVNTKSTQLDENGIYEKILKVAIKSIKDAEKGSLIKIDEDHGVRFVAVEGYDYNVAKRIEFSLETTFLYIKTNGKLDRTVRIDNSEEFNIKYNDEKLAKQFQRLGSFQAIATLVTPIIVDNKAIGMLNLDSTKKDAFVKSDFKKIEIFASKAADIIEYFEKSKEFEKLSKYDKMTGAFNKDYFNELHIDIHNSKDVLSYVLGIIDFNNLKEINKKFGYDVGDMLLIELVENIKKFLPKEASLARYSGDQFILIFPNENVDLCNANIKMIEDYSLRNPLKINGQEVFMQLSYGVAVYPSDTDKCKDMIVIAEERANG